MNVSSVSISPAERRRVREFAELLEDTRPAVGHELESLVALAATLRPAPLTPRAEFRTALRESLVAQAAERPVLAPAPADPPRRRHPVRTAVAGVVLASLVGGVGAAAASTHALPGDPLYGLKRGIESAQLRFAHSDLSRGRELLDQANNRLSEAEDMAASKNARSPETKARIATAIADLNTATVAGVKAFNASYADTGDVGPMIELNRFVVDQRARLADLSALLSPDLRALLGPLSARLVSLNTRLDSLVKPASVGPAPTAPADATGSSGAPSVPGAVATDTIDGLTGGATSAPAGVVSGAVGKGGTTSVPSAVPRVSLPPAPVPSIPVQTAPAPSIPVPGVPTPSIPVPGVPAPSIPVPNISVPAPISTPSLPVTPPTCVAIPPLTDC